MNGISLLQDFAVVLVVAGISGWIFRRLGLSAVVGYLVAGIIIGPFTPPFTLVSDVDRIETLTDLGLAFLMFFVGLNLSLKRIRRLGIGVVAATAITAFCVFHMCQGFAALMGWDSMVAFIFAAMLMTSSSAIITKMLAESGLTHERFARNAMGVTVLEDIVAIVLLTILSSRLQIGETPPRAVGDTLLLLMGFTAIVVVIGLILVPKLLQRFGRASDADLSAVLVSGLVFLAGVASILAGFSVALGAFLFGVVIAETRFKTKIEKSLGGAQVMFSAIFFVAIGMLIDIRAFVDNAAMIATISVFAIVARTLAATIGFVVTGSTLPLAVGSAIVLTPIGEFAYVIARLGVDGEAVPSSFYAVAVGVSIVTAICVPLFAKSSTRICSFVEKVQAVWLLSALNRYRTLLDRLILAFSRNRVWQLTRRRTGIAFLQILLLSGLFGFANPMKSGLATLLTMAGYSVAAWEIGYWITVSFLSIVLIIAIWHSLQTLCLVYAEALSLRSDNPQRRRVITQFIFQSIAAISLGLGVWIGTPIHASTPVIGLAILALMVSLYFVLHRQLTSIGIRIENSLTGGSSAGGKHGRIVSMTASVKPKNWDLDVRECEILEDAQCVGKPLSDLSIRLQFGCSILEIDRQGFIIDRIRSNEVLYPGDRVLLFGSSDQIEKAREFLAATSRNKLDTADFEEALLDTVLLPENSKINNLRLAESRILDETGIQIMGIERNAIRIMNPSGKETLLAGDQLLVLGSAVEIREFKNWLQA